MDYEKGLYIRIEQMTGNRAPAPYPLESGFSADLAYRVIGIFSPSETSEAYLILSNDSDQIWFISNRHVRTAGYLERGPFRVPLKTFTA